MTQTGRFKISGNFYKIGSLYWRIGTASAFSVAIGFTDGSGSDDSQIDFIDYDLSPERHFQTVAVPSAHAFESFDAVNLIVAIDSDGTLSITDGSGDITLIQDNGRLAVYLIDNITWDTSFGEDSAFITCNISSASTPSGAPYHWSTTFIIPVMGTVIQSTIDSPLVAFGSSDSCGLGFSVYTGIVSNTANAPWVSQGGTTNADGIQSQSMEWATLDNIDDAGEQIDPFTNTGAYVALEIG